MERIIASSPLRAGMFFIYYINNSGNIAGIRGFGSYSLIPDKKILFFSATTYRINILAFQFIFYPILPLFCAKDSSSQSALIKNL